MNVNSANTSRSRSPILTPAFLALLVLTPGTSQAGEGPLRQVAGILDYVGSDYAVAVGPDGTILSPEEYEEQLSLTREAMELARDAGLAEDDAVLLALGELLELLGRRPPPEAVLETCRAVRGQLVANHGLVLEPHAIVTRERARELYVSEKCGECHGDDGGADTEKARELEPAPANFLDPDRVAGVSPHRAFHAITFGVDGTGMAEYDYLPAAERWGLAFHVLALRHESADADAGARVLERAGRPVSPTITRLSQLTEDDIRASLARAVDDPRERDVALAFLRGHAPFLPPAEGPLVLARTRLREGAAAYRRGETQVARELFVSAYLDGIEPYEAILAARRGGLVARVERDMLELREACASDAAPDEIDRRVTIVLNLLDTAEEGRLEGAASFAASLVIALREGLEAALLIGALLTIVRRRGAAASTRLVHGGWLVAVVLGIVTWFAIGGALGGLEREVAEGIVALVAAAVLLLVTHWTVGQATARHWMGAVSRRLGDASGRGAATAIFFLAFVAVYREAVEVVLFYQALLLDAATNVAMVWAGAITGLAILLLVVLVVRRLGRSVDPRRSLLACSVLLAGLAVVLVGKGIHSLQEASVFPLTLVTHFQVPSLGLHGTLEGLSAQAALTALLLVSAVIAFAGGRGGDRRAALSVG